MRKKIKNQAKLVKTSQSHKKKAPLQEHLHELKRRLFYVAVSVGIWSAAAYGVQSQLITVLLRPSHGQHFVYTSPLGGVNFLFSVCIFIGIAFSLPVIVFNLLKFILPLMRSPTSKFIYGCSVASGLVAVGGMFFGYYAGLPAALHFLLHQFNNPQVSALISIQSYFSFVRAYMMGAAIMFQLPLLLIIINRIKPLKPSQMFKAERAVIAFAFIAGFIMNPTPNVIDQMFVVIPIIIMYQIGIGLVWFVNSRNGHVRYHKLFEQDAETQAERLRQATAAKPLLDQQLAANILTPVTSKPVLVPVTNTGVSFDISPIDHNEVSIINNQQTVSSVASMATPRGTYATQYATRPTVSRSTYTSLGSRLIQ
jgi:sec-independent protein translocase protein TatC